MVKPLLYERELVARIHGELVSSHEFRIATALVSTSGVDELYPSIQRCIEKGGRGKILLGVDLPSDPRAIEKLRKLASECRGDLELKYFRPLKNRIFHPKLYLFSKKTSQHSAIIGSSNFTGGGLTENHEANLWVQSGKAVNDLTEYFDEHFEGAYSSKVTPEWLADYRKTWKLRKKLFDRLRRLRRKNPPTVLQRIRTKDFPRRIKGTFIAFTGGISGWPRKRKLYPLVKGLGGEIAEIGGVARADGLVQAEFPRGQKTTRKLRRANGTGIPIITEEEFWRIVSREKYLRGRGR